MWLPVLNVSLVLFCVRYVSSAGIAVEVKLDPSITRENRICEAVDQAPAMREYVQSKVPDDHTVVCIVTVGDPMNDIRKEVQLPPNQKQTIVLLTATKDAPFAGNEYNEYVSFLGRDTSPTYIDLLVAIFDEFTAHWGDRCVFTISTKIELQLERMLGRKQEFRAISGMFARHKKCYFVKTSDELKGLPIVE